jgi:hypothetical protein
MLEHGLQPKRESFVPGADTLDCRSRRESASTLGSVPLCEQVYRIHPDERDQDEAYRKSQNRKFQEFSTG